MWSYVFTGIASSLGRPLSYWTFALQAGSWPTSPEAFRCVNLILHALNACLVFIFARLMAGHLSILKAQRPWFAAVVAAVWLLLPLHASTVFYVVQRMTILAATFTLLGLIGSMYWLRSCSKQGLLPLLWASVFVGVGYLGGVLNKENGILLGAFLIVVYSFGGIEYRRRNVAWLVVWGISPLALLTAFLLLNQRYLDGYSIRDFDLQERLMTQPSVLWDYLLKILWPSAPALNVYNDGFPVVRQLWSSAFWEPVGGWLLLLGLAFKLRNSVPALLFGLLWFFAGHLLESSFVGLEMYFEHRNYMPSIGIVIALSGLAFALYNKLARTEDSSLPRILLGVVLFGFILLNIRVLHTEAVNWGDQSRFSASAISDRPESLRAWQDAAAYFANTGDYKTAAQLMHGISLKWPTLPSTALGQLMLNCYDTNVKVPSPDKINQLLTTGFFDRGVNTSLKQLYDFKKQGVCSDLDWQQYREYVNSAISNQNLSGLRENMVVLLSYSLNAEERYIEAAEALELRHEKSASIGFFILKARFYAMAGQYEEALGICGRAREKFEKDFKTWRLHGDLVNQLEKNIRVAMENNEN